MPEKRKAEAPHAKGEKRRREAEDITAIQNAVAELSVESCAYTTFTELPLSRFTQAGLKSANFVKLTDIQARAVPLALRGRDILGAAKTGSGKTLAFLVPVLENLYRRHHVGKEAGLGALIISPTRELAVQIFQVLQAIGSKGHTFSAGLIIGGKKSLSLEQEQLTLVRMNIIVCTPGRMLQHLSQAASLNIDNLQMLVLDEADRILDMGFQRELDSILDYLPKQRQTMLFSATQSKKLSDLARLSLKDPEYISVHMEATNATPKRLTQTYILTPLPQKLDTLWSFIQNTKKSKILVFLSSGKQVRFVFESFRHLQPGIPLLHLHGRQKQLTRLQVTKKFEAAQASCLLATDIVARGLDFPAVDWVVQVDCPEDADTYIHRVGRTARYERDGHAVLFLDPSEEEGMLKSLEAKRVPIEKVNVKGNKKKSIQKRLQDMCFKDAQLKYLGQKAFSSYVRSIYIQKQREIFQVDRLPLEEYAASLGLPGAPRIKFLAGDDAKARKNAPRAPLSHVPGYQSETDDSEADDDVVEEPKKSNGVKSKYDRMFERQNQDVFADHYNRLVAPSLEAFEMGNNDSENEDDDENKEPKEKIQADDFLSIKRRIPAEGDPAITDSKSADARYVNVAGASAPILIDSKRAEKRLQSKKAMLKYKDKGTRILFDDETGEARPVYEIQTETEFRQLGASAVLRDTFVRQEKAKVAHEDVLDKEFVKQRKREKRDKRREAERLARAENDDDDDDDDDAAAVGYGVRLPSPSASEEKLAADSEEEREDGRDESEVEERPAKKQKWFQKNGKIKQQKNHVDELDNFEDMEKFAAGLLAS